MKRAKLSGVMSILLLMLSISGYGQDTGRADLSVRERHQLLASGKAAAMARQLALDKKFGAGDVRGLDDYDVTYYDIYWHPTFEDSSIYGEVTMYATAAVDNLYIIDLNMIAELYIDSVYNEGGRLPSSHTTNTLRVYLDQPINTGDDFHFTIVYHGHPTVDYSWIGGFYFNSYNGTPIMENLSEPFMARNFWPCKDVPWDKADSVDVRIRCKTEETATSNGVLVDDIDNGDGTHTMHWRGRYPITTYLICIAVSVYDSWTQYYYYGDNDSMPITHYVFPDQYDNSYEAYSVCPDGIAIFASLFGEYPFINEKYGNTMCYVHGMEHQNNTFLNRYLSTYVDVVIHELAHHWWGDLVTCQDWHHIWLNEGFATYCEALYLEALGGETAYHSWMDNFIMYDGGTVYSYDVTDPWAVFGLLQYYKGAYVLHMLRHVIGDEAFFAGFLNYAQTYAYANATTEQFMSEMEAAGGMELDQFFSQWVYGEYYPYYDYAFKSEPGTSGNWTTYFNVSQIQTIGADVYYMPVDVRLDKSDGTSETHVVQNDRREQNFIFTTDARVTYVKLDPDGWILRKALRSDYNFHIANDYLENPATAQYYEDTVLVKGTASSYTCSVIDGQLPDGFALDPSTGIISGISLSTGVFTFTAEAFDNAYPNLNESRTYTITFVQPDDRPGDANADGATNVGDAVFVINYVFKSGSAPLIINWADPNADCFVNVGDAVYLINFVFKDGPAPQTGCVD